MVLAAEKSRKGGMIHKRSRKLQCVSGQVQGFKTWKDTFRLRTWGYPSSPKVILEILKSEGLCSSEEWAKIYPLPIFFPWRAHKWWYGIPPPISGQDSLSLLTHPKFLCKHTIQIGRVSSATLIKPEPTRHGGTSLLSWHSEGRRQVDVCEFEISVVCIKFQASQGYVVRLVKAPWVFLNRGGTGNTRASLNIKER